MRTADEQQILDYFLGRLEQAEAELLEETLAESDEEAERAEIIEQELIDDFVRGRLSADGRILFEKNYPTTEARREKIKTAGYFFEVMKETAAPAAAGQKSGRSYFSFLQIPGFRLAAVTAGLFLILTAGGFGIWYLTRTEDLAGKQNESVFTEPGNAPPSDRPAALPENKPVAPDNAPAASMNKKTNEQPRNRTPEPDNRKTSPERRTPTTTVAVFALTPTTFRSGGEQIVQVPNLVKKIILKLKLPPEAEKNVSYRAEFKTADGEIVFSAPAAPSSGGTVSINVPASQMANKNYIVFLTGKNGEAAAEYVFRVVRKQ